MSIILVYLSLIWSNVNFFALSGNISAFRTDGGRSCVGPDKSYRTCNIQVQYSLHTFLEPFWPMCTYTDVKKSETRLKIWDFLWLIIGNKQKPNKVNVQDLEFLIFCTISRFLFKCKEICDTVHVNLFSWVLSIPLKHMISWNSVHLM